MIFGGPRRRAFLNIFRACVFKTKDRFTTMMADLDHDTFDAE